MALSNCRSNGVGLRLRYRLEVFGYANDDRCASGAAPLLAVARGSAAVRSELVAAELRSSTAWTFCWRLADALVLRCEQCTSSVVGLAIALSLSAVWTSLRTS